MCLLVSIAGASVGSAKDVTDCLLVLLGTQMVMAWSVPGTHKVFIHYLLKQPLCCNISCWHLSISAEVVSLSCFQT